MCEGHQADPASGEGTAGVGVWPRTTPPLSKALGGGCGGTDERTDRPLEHDMAPACEWRILLVHSFIHSSIHPSEVY